MNQEEKDYCEDGCICKWCGFEVCIGDEQEFQKSLLDKINELQTKLNKYEKREAVVVKLSDIH